MRYHSDHSFTIGTQHLRQGKPCQDYALSGTYGATRAYAVVSDGCSTGGMTDIGARLMSLATVRAITDRAHQPLDLSSILTHRDALFSQFHRTIGLDQADLLATALCAVADEESVHISVVGDGAVVLTYEHGTIAHLYAWDRSIPYYPIYALCGHDDAFRASHNASVRPLAETVYRCVHGTTEQTERSYSLEDGMRGITHVVSLGDPALGALVSVTLMTDGVTQVDGITVPSVLTSLTSFKSTAGQFVSRRLNRFIEDARSTGRGPHDDLACAAIACTYPERSIP